MDQNLWLPLAGLFLSVALATGMVAAYLLRRTNPVERRLREFQTVGAQPVRLSDLDLTQGSYGSLERLSTMLPKSLKQMSKVQRRLSSAGIERREAAVLYVLAEIALPIVFGFATLIALGSSSLLPALFAAAIGYLLPGLWLGQRTATRKKQIQNGLPDALDLLLVSVEAGSGLDQSMMKVGHELEHSYPALANEFRIIVSEIRAGRPRAEALRAFFERTKVEDVRSLVDDDDPDGQVRHEHRTGAADARRYGSRETATAR